VSQRVNLLNIFYLAFHIFPIFKKWSHEIIEWLETLGQKCPPRFCTVCKISRWPSLWPWSSNRSALANFLHDLKKILFNWLKFCTQKQCKFKSPVWFYDLMCLFYLRLVQGIVGQLLGSGKQKWTTRFYVCRAVIGYISRCEDGCIRLQWHDGGHYVCDMAWKLLVVETWQYIGMHVSWSYAIFNSCLTGFVLFCQCLKKNLRV
jgi:hypothetical protein